MIARSVVFCMCLVSIPLASTALGVNADASVTPKYIAAHPGEFKVEVTEREATFEVTITRFGSRRQWWWRGDLLIKQIQKQGVFFVKCELQPNDIDGGVQYKFRLSHDLAPAASFTLSERALAIASGREVGGMDGETFHFRLSNFAGTPQAER